MKKSLLNRRNLKARGCLLILLVTFLTGKASEFTFSPINTSNGLSDNQIRHILQLQDGRMVFTTSGNVNIYDGFRFQYIHRSDEHIAWLSKYDGHYRIYQSRDSLLWIKDHHKLMCIDLRQEQYISDLDSMFRRQGVKDSLQDLFLDDDQRMWLLIDQGLLQPESGTLLHDVNKAGKLQDLGSDDDCLYLFYDTGEVICYDLKTGKRLYAVAAFTTQQIPSFQRTSLVVKGHRGFYQLRNGSKGGFFYFSLASRSWETLLETDYTLNTLIITPDEKAYVSCVKGIWVIDRSSGAQRHFPSLKVTDGSLVSTHISTLFYDQQGALWVGTFNRGLLYHHPSRYALQKIDKFPVSDPSKEDFGIEAFAEGQDSIIYLKSGAAFYRFDSKADDHASLTPILKAQLPESVRNELDEKRSFQRFRGKTYTDLCTDHRGWVWGGTSDGLALFSSERGASRMLYTDDGLINNFVHAILEDQRHQIWITTSKGISRVNIDSLDGSIHFTNMNAYDGTLSGEYLNGADFEATDGRLFFGGIDGFNVYSPDGHTIPQVLLKPVVRTFRIHGERVVPGKTFGERMILSQAVSSTRKITLDYHQNFLTLEYSALNYINPEQTHYRYRLEGLDQEWITVHPEVTLGGILSIGYTNLAPGNYTLQVMASNQNGHWNETVNELSITIFPPWWETTSAWCIYAVSFLMVSSGTFYLYTRYAREKLQRQHKEEILLLRIRNLIEQRNSYEATQQEKQEPDEIAHQKESQNPADMAFLKSAMELVEKNINISDYSVEQLSRDLCMERTGLYRKLITLLDESPSLFIRNIRLQRAAKLILEENATITQIANRVGFSSSSYFSKCFQEMYGCRPSEYPTQQRNQPE